jgi:flagellar biosynthesis anti-sigma factor FlgM
MSSIKINKPLDSEAIHSIGRSDVRKTGKNGSQPVENKSIVESDKVNISSVALETGKLVEQIKELPDVRLNRVDELKQQISSGNFKPTGNEIADAILKDEKVVNS